VLLVVDGSRPDETLALGPGQRVDSAVEPFPGELLGLTRARAETGAPEEPLGLNRSEAAPVDGNLACSRQRVPLLCIGSTLLRLNPRAESAVFERVDRVISDGRRERDGHAGKPA
jgi:hypothetical protein